MVQSTKPEQHTIIALVEDKPGVLTRIASMFRRRGFNIASLAVGRSEKPGLSRMTFVVDGDLPTVQQVTRQLDKLIDVIEVSYISTHQVVARELALIKVTTTAGTRGEIMQFAELFDANIVDVSPLPWSSKSRAANKRLTRWTTCCAPSESPRWCGPAWWPWCEASRERQWAPRTWASPSAATA